jgi:hypothetical protein
MRCAGDEADFRVEAIERIKKSLATTLSSGNGIFVENEDWIKYGW